MTLPGAPSCCAWLTELTNLDLIAHLNNNSIMPKSGEVLGLNACATKSVDRKRVAVTRRFVVGPQEAARLSDLFRLLGDPTRMRLLFALLEAGELCVCDLAETVQLPETSVSHALRLLRTAGVVRNRRGGRMVFYRLDDAHVRLLLDLAREHLRHERDGERAKER